MKKYFIIIIIIKSSEIYTKHHIYIDLYINYSINNKKSTDKILLKI